MTPEAPHEPAGIIMLTDGEDDTGTVIRDVAFGRVPKFDRVCNFDPCEIGMLPLAIAASKPGEIRPANLEGSVFPVVWWMVGYHMVRDEENDRYVRRPFVSLINADMVRFQTSSDGVIQNWNEIVRYKGPGPYDPPLNVRLHVSELDDGRTAYTILPVT